MKDQSPVALVLKAIALAMSVAVVVMGILGTGQAETYTTLLGIGMLALAALAFQTKS